MSNENTTDSPTSVASEPIPDSIEAVRSDTTNTSDSEVSGLSQESIEATSSALPDAEKSKSTDPTPANVAGSKAPEFPTAMPNAAPAASTSTGRELRIEPRIRVKWRVDALIDGQGMYQGFVKDISLSGTDVFLGHNLQKVKFVKLRIYVPPLSKTSSPHVMEVSATVRYTAYDSRESLFHTGVKFSQFNLGSDQAYLQSRIATINQANK